MLLMWTIFRDDDSGAGPDPDPDAGVDADLEISVASEANVGGGVQGMREVFGTEK